MDIREQIMTDVKTAMRDKDQLKLNTLRFLQAAVKNKEIDLRPAVITSDDVMTVIKKLVKQRKESIEQYQLAQRQDLVDQEMSELKILETYLPSQMSREQVEALVVQVMTALNAKTVKDMGPVMKEVIAKSQGTADNKLVSEIIKSKLS
ncbi:MAG: GatB/YqeY domain-containing protein [Pseudobdellovibrionaceae bacterium]